VIIQNRRQICKCFEGVGGHGGKVTTRRYEKADAYKKQKARAKARLAAVTLAGQDIGGLPSIADWVRRGGADRAFRFFCETCFPYMIVFSPVHGALPPRQRGYRPGLLGLVGG